MTSRRGQFEILGIAIFIVIVIIGITIFIMLPDNAVEDPAKSYEAEQLAQSLVDTMVRTQMGPACVDQPEATFYDLIRDVAILSKGLCDKNIDTSKTLLEKSAKAMIESATGSDYEFRIYLASAPPAPPPLVTLGECPPGRGVVRERIGEQRIPLLPYTDTVIVELQLCSGRA